MRLSRPVLLLAAAAALVGGPSAARAQSTATGPVVRFSTSLGDVDVQLRSDVAPATVANFLGYLDRGDYNGTFIHRSAPGFVVQGGGYSFVNGQVETVPAQAPVVNEFYLSNVRGTIAMAKIGPATGQPPTSETINSATNQWFFNLADNTANLNSQNGGFTVFGQVLNSQGLAVVDAIAAVPIYNFNSPFDSIPLVNYVANADVTADNFVQLRAVTRVLSRSALGVVGAPERGGFVVSRTGGLDTAVTVTYRNGGSAIRGQDYVTFPGTLTLPAGQSEAVIPVTLLSGVNRNHKVKVFLDPAPDNSFDITKFQSKVFLTDLP